MKIFVKFSFFLAILLFSYNAAALVSGQSAPKRIFSIGDSITRAYDAYLPKDNLNISWANGYYGFWQKLLGLPNIYSHYQRIRSAYGSWGTRNVTVAANGASMANFPDMAAIVAGTNSTYVPVLLGANDICSSPIWHLPENGAFETNFRNGMNALVANLPDGATIYVAAIPDIEQVYQVGLTKDALGLVSCPVVWTLNHICQSMLALWNTPEDRDYVTSRIQGYNEILKRVTQEYPEIASNLGRKLFISFTRVTNDAFSASEISDIDCFHPSELGQKTISSKTWLDGPLK